MKTITIEETEYGQMKENIHHLQEQLNLLQDVNFRQKLQTFVGLYIQINENITPNSLHSQNPKQPPTTNHYPLTTNH